MKQIAIYTLFKNIVGISYNVSNYVGLPGGKLYQFESLPSYRIVMQDNVNIEEAVKEFLTNYMEERLLKSKSRELIVEFLKKISRKDTVLLEQLNQACAYIPEASVESYEVQSKRNTNNNQDISCDAGILTLDEFVHVNIPCYKSVDVYSIVVSYMINGADTRTSKLCEKYGIEKTVVESWFVGEKTYTVLRILCQLYTLDRSDIVNILSGYSWWEILEFHHKLTRELLECVIISDDTKKYFIRNIYKIKKDDFVNKDSLLPKKFYPNIESWTYMLEANNRQKYHELMEIIYKNDQLFTKVVHELLFDNI